MKFSIKDFFSKCDQIRSFLRTWSHLLKKSLIENFIFCAVKVRECANSMNKWIDTTPEIYNFQYISSMAPPKPETQHKDGDLSWVTKSHYPANIYLFKVNNRNTRKRCCICSKLTIKTPERRHWRRTGVFIVNF